MPEYWETDPYYILDRNDPRENVCTGDLRRLYKRAGGYKSTDFMICEKCGGIIWNEIDGRQCMLKWGHFKEGVLQGPGMPEKYEEKPGTEKYIPRSQRSVREPSTEIRAESANESRQDSGVHATTVKRTGDVE